MRDKLIHAALAFLPSIVILTGSVYLIFYYVGSDVFEQNYDFLMGKIIALIILSVVVLAAVVAVYFFPKISLFYGLALVIFSFFSSNAPFAIPWFLIDISVLPLVGYNGYKLYNQYFVKSKVVK